MEELKKLIQNHTMKVILAWYLLIIAIIIVMIIGKINYKSLTSYCQVYNEADLDRCYKENPYVEIHTDKVYSTSYEYLEDEKVLAKFLDVNLDNFFMIALVSPTKAEQLIYNESGNIVISGKLEKFNSEAKLDGYDKIKSDYVEQFKEEYTKEEVINNFTSIQLNEFRGSKDNLYFLTVIAMCFIILIFVIVIKQVQYIIYPEKYRLNKNITLKEEKVANIIEELESNNYHYHDKKIYITEHYIVSKKRGVAVAEKKNIAWICEKKETLYGITFKKGWDICSFDQKRIFHLSSKGKNHQQLGEFLQQEFPNINVVFLHN